MPMECLYSSHDFLAWKSGISLFLLIFLVHLSGSIHRLTTGTKEESLKSDRRGNLRGVLWVLQDKKNNSATEERLNFVFTWRKETHLLSLCSPADPERYRWSALQERLNGPSYSPESSQTAITRVQVSAVNNISQQKQLSAWFTFSAVDSVHNCHGHHQLSLTSNILQRCLEIALPGVHFINVTNHLPFHCFITLHNLSQCGRSV